MHCPHLLSSWQIPVNTLDCIFHTQGNEMGCIMRARYACGANRVAVAIHAAS